MFEVGIKQKRLTGNVKSTQGRAGKNLRFIKKRFRFLGFLGFNVRTVARDILDTGIRSRRSPMLLCTKIN